MKYCKNCGMLLEDSIERCIRCGTDVSVAANVSMYPPDVEARMQKNKAEQKNKNTLIIVLIAVFVLLAVLIGLIVFKASQGELQSRDSLRSASEKTVEAAETVETPAEEIVTEEPDEPVSNREVKDENGTYYVCAPQSDAAGNHIFNAIYPEDISNYEFNVDTERYSSTFSVVMSSVANNEDNSVRFSYTSPQQLWYKKSEKGHSRSNERDPQYFMSFYTFEDAKTYIDALVKQSYPKAKKIEMTSENNVSDAVTAAVGELSKQRQDYFLNEKIGDYAHLGEDAEYATTTATYSAEVFEYQITDSDKNVIYCKYYVPVISNDLMYTTEIGMDMGTITEWYVLCVCGFEAGNDIDYDDYSPAFEMFCANAVPTRLFFYLNHCLEEDINDAIAAGNDPEFADETKLKFYGAKYKNDSEIGDLNEAIYKVLGSYGSKTFSSEDMTVRTADDISIAYYDKDKNKLFVSPDESEYPGDTYEELTLNE